MSPTAVTPEQFSSFGELLKYLRRQARITQRELAIAVGYSDTQISRIEQNQRVPDSVTVTALFVPALYIEQEPKWVTRLLELAKAAQVGGMAEMGNIADIPTGTVTFLFTDIEGSTKLAREYPETWEALCARHHIILREAIESNHGIVFQVIGDGFCAAFHTAGDALNAAHQAQKDLQSEAWGEAAIRVRMGIHTGEAEAHANEYHGYLSLSLVQQLMSAGHGGQVLVSGAAEYLLREQLPKDVSLRDLGKHNFKHVLQSVRIFQVSAPDLQNDFPALRTFDVLPNNLPMQLTSFIGREKELADVKILLHDAHMLTLTGPGGTGKTRLSIQAAGEALDQYPDGVWFVELAPILDPLLVPRTTAIAMGLRDEPQRPVIDMLCDYLREKKMLIVLDNCEHLMDACAQMADRVLHAASNTRIFASSREALGIAGEVTYQVPSLGLPDLGHLPSVESLSQYEAVRLFIDRATAAVSTFTVTNDNAPALAQICHRLDGIPLAIELAAAKIRVLSLEQIAKRLDDRFRLLTGGSRTALERHQTLRAAIDWSYNLLSEQEQTLFRRLAVFVDGWTLEAAESVCCDPSTLRHGERETNRQDDAALPKERVATLRASPSGIRSEDVLNLLEHLINKSLVIAEEKGHESRYRMLETMRQYAHEKLVDAGESDALREGHLDYFLQFAESAAPHLIRPEQLEWLAQLNADYENLRAALEWALSEETAELSLRLCAALGKFWHIRSYWLEGSKWLKSALSKPAPDSSAAEKAARVKALYQDAELADELGDRERLKNSAELSLALAQEGTDQLDIAIARSFVGFALYRRDDYEHARLLMQQSLTEFRELGDPYWESMSYRALNFILVRQEKIKFFETARQSLELARKAGERLNLAYSLNYYAYCLYHLNQMDNAKKCAEEALLILEQVGSQLNFPSSMLTMTAWFSGDYEKVRSLYTEVKERSSLLGDISTKSYAISSLGLLAIEENDLSQAQAYIEEALMLARELKSAIDITTCLNELGYVSYLQGNIKKFKQNFRESISFVNERDQLQKSELLCDLLIPISDQTPENSARILGVIDSFQEEIGLPTDPWAKRYRCDRAEAHARESLGDAAFESAFAEGQKMSLDEALDLALKTVEEM